MFVIEKAYSVGMVYSVVIPVSASVQLSTRLDADEISFGNSSFYCITQTHRGKNWARSSRQCLSCQVEGIGCSCKGIFVLSYYDYNLKTFPAWVYEEEGFREQIEREIDLCVLLRSPNIVYAASSFLITLNSTFYGSCLSPEHCIIVMVLKTNSFCFNGNRKLLKWEA